MHTTSCADIFSGLPNTKRTSSDLPVIQANMYRPNVQQWTPGIANTYPPENSANVSNNLAYGAWTNAPSEKLGFWFSGLQAANGGYINLQPNLSTKADQPNTTSRTFIKVDMSSPQKALWQNLTWPTWLAPRSEGGLVWLPYGQQGMLLAFGGIDLPGDLSTSGINLNSTYKKQQTNDYMTNIGVYDIAQDAWAMQSTQEKIKPPQMAHFCTVTTSALDNSSHFVYVFGGYDGTYANFQAYDSIWVLSVPAFQWTKLSDGDLSHGRARHFCALPNPTQMFSIGGASAQGSLLNPDFFDVYDLNAQAWTHYYNHSSNVTYRVPSAVLTQLGQGNENGGFTVPSVGLNDSVANLVKTTYAKIVPASFPYSATPTGNDTVPVVPTQTTTITSTPTPTPRPSWEIPVIASLCSVGGIAILGALFFFCCCRRKRKTDQNGNTKRNSIFSWMNNSDEPKQPPSDPDTERTAVNHNENFNSKAMEGIHEMSSNYTSTTGINGHGSPRLVGSPSFGGEMESSPRHEIMTHPTRDSMSIGQHPYYPPSIQGDFINRSVRSDSISSPSQSAIPSTLNAQVTSRGNMSPFELGHDRSKENLPNVPNDNVLDVSSEGHSAYGVADQVHSPQAMSPAVARKPISPDARPVTPPSTDQRPRHHRHQSSLSSDVPTLPSPGPAEDQRRSRMIDGLPEIQQSPVSQGPTKKSSGPLKSAWQEKFD